MNDKKLPRRLLQASDNKPSDYYIDTKKPRIIYISKDKKTGEIIKQGDTEKEWWQFW